MLAGFKNTLDSILSLLKENDLNARYMECEGRFLFRIEEMMCDAGFGCDNVVLDVFFDEDEKVLFIGLLRFPKGNRRSGLGKKILIKIMEYANQHHFFIYLDAWNESQPFWKKYGFKHVYTDKYHFEILGYSGDGLDIFHEWEEFKKTKVFNMYLTCHEEQKSEAKKRKARAAFLFLSIYLAIDGMNCILSFSRIGCKAIFNVSLSVSFNGISGNLKEPVSRPFNSSAALTGEGLGAANKAFIIGKAESQLRQIGRTRAGKLYRWLLDADLALTGASSSPAKARLVLEQLLVRISARQLEAAR